MTGGKDGDPLAALRATVSGLDARDWVFYATVVALLAGVYVLWVLD